jgi:hypothetical protein
LDGSEDGESSIEAEEDLDEFAEVDEEEEVLTDQIRASKKVNSIVMIEALRLKPSSLLRMPVPLCRLVAIPIMRSTLSSNLTTLEDDFVHGYWEGVVVFYLSTINEGG